MRLIHERPSGGDWPAWETGHQCPQAQVLCARGHATVEIARCLKAVRATIYRCLHRSRWAPVACLRAGASGFWSMPRGVAELEEPGSRTPPSMDDWPSGGHWHPHRELRLG